MDNNKQLEKERDELIQSIESLELSHKEQVLLSSISMCNQLNFDPFYSRRKKHYVIRSNWTSWLWSWPLSGKRLEEEKLRWKEGWTR